MENVKNNIMMIIGHVEELGYGMQGMYFGTDKVELDLVIKNKDGIVNLLKCTINKNITHITLDDIKLGKV